MSRSNEIKVFYKAMPELKALSILVTHYSSLSYLDLDSRLFRF